MRVLVTGGAGYIGSHICVSLADRGHDAVILDNFSTSDPAVLGRLRGLVGAIPHVRADTRDVPAIRAALRQFNVEAVVHCAGLKSVSDSMRNPVEYFDNNVVGAVALLTAMREEGVRQLVFSSSATVYGVPDSCPVNELAPLRVLNPYGRSKRMVEEILRDALEADTELRVAMLRYFNPVGAHESGLIGESPINTPTNVMPLICQVAGGQRERLAVFGGDFPTRDGTGERDYIHVVDLADAHAAAIEFIARQGRSVTVNVGTGRGHTVLELVRAMEDASSRKIPYVVVGRRAGDAASVFADPSLAQRLLGWSAKRTLKDMCDDAWRWQMNNPRGYADDRRIAAALAVA